LNVQLKTFSTSIINQPDQSTSKTMIDIFGYFF